MNFQEKRIVRLSETDATGVLYFTNLLKYGEEAFSGLLKQLGVDLARLFEEGDLLFPIVSAQSDYFAPLFFGDEITVTQTLLPPRRCSITLKTVFEKEGKVVGQTEITHVFTSKATRKSVSIPEEFRELCNVG